MIKVVSASIGRSCTGAKQRWPPDSTPQSGNPLRDKGSKGRIEVEPKPRLDFSRRAERPSPVQRGGENESTPDSFESGRPSNSPPPKSAQLRAYVLTCTAGMARTGYLWGCC